jgi:uncharacterized protein (DUF488 family)
MPPVGPESAPRIYTVGHSTRTWDELVELLVSSGLRQLADVRSFPGSRRHPHFARSHLEVALPAAGIAYRWMPGLGGRRRLGAGPSPNTAWRVAGFRAYADYMATEEFRAARAELESWARSAPTAFMCAEARYLMCHRQLLADALVARGWDVVHLETVKRVQLHVLTSFARVGEEGDLTYPGDPELPFLPEGDAES